MTLRKVSREMTDVDLSSLGIASRLVANVASQADVRVTGGVERVTLEGDTDGLTGIYTPRDSRVTLSGPWVVITPVNADPNNFGVPLDNPEVSGTRVIRHLANNAAGSKVTINWRGSSLILLTAKTTGGGTFTVENDGGGSVTHDTYSLSGTSYTNPILVASGLTYGDHTTVITVTGTKGGGGAANNASVSVLGFDILTTTDSTVKYTPGTGYPLGESATVALAGSLNIGAIGTSLGRKDLVILRNGATVPEVVAGTATNSGDALATFQANNEIAFRVEAEDTSGKLANVWWTNASLRAQSSSGGFSLALGTAITESDTSSTDYFVIGFIGTGIAMIGQKASNQGQFAWSIDGGSETTVDTYAALTQLQVSYQMGYNLPYGYHQLKIRKLGIKNASSSGYLIGIDAFDIYHPKAPACPADAMPLAEVIPTPADGWMRYDTSATSVFSGANWAEAFGTDRNGGNSKNNSNTNTTDNVKFTFVGTQYRIVSRIGSSRGIFAVYLDGVFVQNVDTYNVVGGQDQTIVYTSPAITAAPHTVEVRATNTKHASSAANTFDVDAFDIIPLPAQVRDVRNFSVIGDDKLEKLEEKLTADGSVSSAMLANDSVTNIKYAEQVLTGTNYNNISLTANTYADVGLSFTMTFTGAPVYAELCSMHCNLSNAYYFELAVNINGTDYSLGTTFHQDAGGTIRGARLLTGIPAGTYTVKGRIRANGSATIGWIPNTNITLDKRAYLIVTEFKK